MFVTLINDFLRMHISLSYGSLITADHLRVSHTRQLSYLHKTTWYM